jgi:hypothetical protein
LWSEIQYPLKELEQLFKANKETNMKLINAQTARIFVDFLERKIDELKELAQEIDDEYAS